MTVPEYKDRKDVNMMDWDIDDDTGSLCYVVFPDKDSSPFGKIYFSGINQEITDWFKENITGKCFYTFENECRELVFYFKKIEDAFLFKLTWG